MTSIIGLIFVSILAIGIVNASQKRILGSDLSPDEYFECESMIDKFESLEVKLHNELGPYPENSTGTAKRLVSNNLQLEILNRIEYSPFERKALNYLMRLGEASKRCDLESYKIFAKIYVIMESIRNQMQWIQGIFTFYRDNHARLCRPVYKEKFHQLISEVDTDDLLRVQTAFELLEPIDVGDDYNHYHLIEPRKRLLLMDLNDFNHPGTIDAQNEIVKQVARQIEESPQWDQKHDNKSEQELRELFNDYLFNPCENYRTKLWSILSSARMDAQLNDNEQEEFIYDDEEFLEAMIYNRLCGKLGDSRQGYYHETFTRRWNALDSAKVI